MIYRFGQFTLDTTRAELTSDGRPVPAERQVLKLLTLLAENGDRLTTRDEIVQAVWDGRAISDAAIDSRISTARSLLGDDGRTQSTIRTVHGQGLRFLLPVQRQANGGMGTDAGQRDGGRPSIAVLPFRAFGDDPELAVMADAIPHEMIHNLSRLRWLVVIARGSTFRFRSDTPDAAAIGATLDARYVLSGTIERSGRRIVVAVILEDNRSGQVVWSERYPATLDDLPDLRNRISGDVVAELEVQIPLNEALVARSAGTQNLDAWASYHLGLHHMYRFTREDNARAAGLFTRAADLDPSFSRAHAGLSFTHFQDAFTHYDANGRVAADQSRSRAERAVELDPREPFANFVMGRYHLLDGDFDQGSTWLQRAISLNPNYAQGIYSKGFMDALAGRADVALPGLESSLRLSPLDPLVYAMLGARALGQVHKGDLAGAAASSDKAFRSPGAHFLIGMLATSTHEMNEQSPRARDLGEQVRLIRPDASRAMFFRSFQITSPTVREQFDRALARHGF
jgi:TolB-like protein